MTFTFAPENSSAPFLPTSTVLPNDLPELIIRLTNYLNYIAYIINIREIANYEEIELLTGQLWLQQTDQSFRQAFRKVVLIPVINAPGTDSVPHGIDISSVVAFTHIFGTINIRATPLFVPIPQGAPDDVSITVDAVNVNVTTTTGTYNGGAAIVVLEYLKN